METQRMVGVGFQKINLFLQLTRVCPIIVTITEGDITTFTFTQSLKEIRHHTEVPFRQKQSDTVRILGLISPAYLARIVRADIVTYEQFYPPLQVLGQHSVNSIGDELSMPICNHTYGYQDRGLIIGRINLLNYRHGNDLIFV
ncbi:MAG: hypothetical protein WAT61_04210 [Flavobacteriales bacterium]